MTEQQRSNLAICTGRISGWREVIDQLPVFLPDMSARIAISTDANNGQLAKILVTYVNVHPEVEDKPALVVFYFALKDAGLIVAPAKGK